MSWLCPGNGQIFFWMVSMALSTAFHRDIIISARSTKEAFRPTFS